MLNILIYCIILLISVYIIVTLFAPKKSMRYFGYKTHVVVSSSMEPDMMVNDVIVIKQVEETELTIGDAITFEVYLPELGEKVYVTHYIGDIEKKDGTTVYHTQGANKDVGDYDQWTNEVGDPIDITYDAISGEVIWIIPFLGYLVRMIQNPIMIVLIGINVSIIYLIIRIIKSPKPI